MTIGDLLPLLKPFQGNRDIIVDDQDTGDIIAQVLRAHKHCAKDYDKIVGMFHKEDLYEQLFYFCQDNLKYKAEKQKDQTTRSPAGILSMTTVDCKHYANFIGGVIAAMERKTGEPIEWAYRFASYDKKKVPGHVFVVVYDGVDEIWIDPTPIIDPLGFKTRRYFNDRLIIPTDSIDEKIKKMSLSHLSGVGATYVVEQPGCNTIGKFSLEDISSSVTSFLDDAGGGSGGGSLPSSGGSGGLVTAGLDLVWPGAGEAVKTALSILPPGGLKDFLTGFLKDPTKAITTLIKGRTYTSGDYKLGEQYMRNILGLEQIQRWEQVPDTYVPQAWQFFTTAYGVRIRTNDDIDALNVPGSPGGKAANYLTRNTEETHDISQAAAIRAATIGANFNTASNRDHQWPLTNFASLPYIFPIPDVVQDTNFTGMHPILNKKIVNGYPEDYTGQRFSSQVSNVPLETAPTGYTPPSTVQTPGLPGLPNPDDTAKNFFSSPIGIGLLVVGTGVVGVLGYELLKKKPAAVKGISTGKAVLIAAGVAAVAGGGYLVYRGKKTADRKAAISKWIATLNDSDEAKLFVISQVNKMTGSEIDIVFDVLEDYIVPGLPVTDVVLKNKFNTISVKYNIFT